MTIQLDCQGMPCPQPVLMARDSLAANPGQTVTILVDNEASKNNVMRFGRSQGCEIHAGALENGCFTVTLVPGDQQTAPGPVNAAEYVCEIPAQGGLVYVIASDTMGRGDDTLGRSLLQTYIQTIKEVQPLPTRIIFYNAGVRLVSEPSAALDALLRLQEQGVSILACGTCLDYYNLKARLQVGQISNMFEIMSAVNEAAKVMSPQ